MATCMTCGKTLIAGGIKDQGYRFCSRMCHQRKAPYLAKMSEISEAAVDAEVESLRTKKCPRCGKNKHIDEHSSVFVYSMIFITRFGRNRHMCCRGCALKAQALDILGTATLGWWGIPFGLIGTPAGIVINLAQMSITLRSNKPSRRLRNFARERLARQAAGML
jgi:endogenous inhibitor of DNA gyrase (YacG/DUF329 family)